MKSRTIVWSLVAAATLAAHLPASPAAAQERALLQVPTDMETGSLAGRRQAQLATRGDFGVFTGFTFADRLVASGITFRHRIVDDAGLTYKPVHYDHGNGVAAGDVDGDGRLDLYFTTQLGRNELWRNAGGGRFEDWTGRAGVGMEDRVSVAASFADVDDDGDPDLYVTTVRTGNALFRNDGGGRFTELTAEAGLAYSGHSSAALFFDYDRDGRLDLLLVNVGRYTVDETGRGGYHVGRRNAFAAHEDPTLAEPSVLYRNLGGGRFEDVSEKVLLVDRSWSGDAAAVDFNGDGFQDLYLLDMQGPDHYYENVRGEFFVDRTERWFARTPPGSMGVKAFDWNRDGRLDLFITDMHSDMIEELSPEREKEKMVTERDGLKLAGLENAILGNAFYEATAEGFREISDSIGVENYWPWGLSAADLNADGWEDLFITASMNYPFRYGVNSLLLNDRGRRFRDAEFLLGVEPRQGELTQPWFDLDCPLAAEGERGEAASDENVVAQMAAGHHHGDLEWTWDQLGAPPTDPNRPHLLCRGIEGPVTVTAAKGSRSSVVFDLDGDGDLDVVTNEFNAPPQVLISDLAQKTKVNWIEVDLVGTRSNRDGLGAKVTVTAGGESQMKVMDGQSGYLSHSSMPLWFGLGEATKVERVEVAWPSGEKLVVDDPPLGERLVITEPEA